MDFLNGIIWYRQTDTSEKPGNKVTLNIPLLFRCSYSCSWPQDCVGTFSLILKPFKP